MGCNCSKQHEGEFCFLRGKGNVEENLGKMLPIRKKCTEKMLADAGLSGHSARRKNAIFVRCAIEELIEAQWWMAEETSKMVDVRTKYIFVGVAGVVCAMHTRKIERITTSETYTNYGNG